MAVSESPTATVSIEAIKKAEEFIEAEEGASNKLGGWLGTFVALLAIAMSVFHLYAAMTIMPTHILRGIHVAFMLFLVFLLFPVAKRFRNKVWWWDWLLAILSLYVMGHMLFGGDAFLERSTVPSTLDTFCGVALMVLILEAVRRCSGWIMPVVVLMFLFYAAIGAKLPPPWTHQGMDTARIVGHMYMTMEGVFGTAIDVSSTLIILFTIYGAFLQYSNAGKFYIDFSFAAMGGKPAGAGRTIVLSSFLLGGPSGSGVATTVTLGSVAYPMLMKAGYGKDAAGGLLAAGGLGAIISPPVLGAAAFLIADALVLLRAVPDGRNRRAQIRHEAGRHRQGRYGVESHQAVRLSFSVVDRDYRFHVAGVLAAGVSVLRHRGGVSGELFASELRADPLRSIHAQNARAARVVEQRSA